MRRKQLLKLGSGAIATLALAPAIEWLWGQAGFAQSLDSKSLSPKSLSPKSLKQCEITLGSIDKIMADGMTSEVQLLRLLKLNRAPLNVYGDLPSIYREEAAIEGVNHDIAFCQMCLETGFLQFGGDVLPEQNNFGGIGAIGNGARGDSFRDRRIGVRAQVQHLKAYASANPLIQPLVDPRFSLVKRGTAPLLGQLSGRWAEDVNYDKKIMAILRRLYELSGFF